MQSLLERIVALEAEMEASGTFVFSGALHGPDATTVVRFTEGANPGPFQLQAAIQAVHCHAASFEATDWPQIVALYDHFLSVMPTPVVALSWAIAIGETEGPGAALAALDAIAADLDHYHLMHAARGTILRRLGQRGQPRPPSNAASSQGRKHSGNSSHSCSSTRRQASL